MNGHRPWNRKEQLLALRLYCYLPFGRLHRNQNDVVQIAEKIGRTPSAVAMKACNFASLDPALTQRGLGNASVGDRKLWQEFIEDSEKIAAEAEEVYSRFEPVTEPTSHPTTPTGNSETQRIVKVRRVQGFFRNTLLVGYKNRCALSGLKLAPLLVASHIIPWRESESRRADPTNGILLNSLYDSAFDKGYISFDQDVRAIISPELNHQLEIIPATKSLFNIQGRKLDLPDRFLPDPKALNWHREHIYKP